MSWSAFGLGYIACGNRLIGQAHFSTYRVSWQVLELVRSREHG